MCGILGASPPVQSDAFCAALDRIAHRGPDDSGIFHDAFVSLGHRRLAIQDLTAAGHQPMSISDGDISIVFNGKIYNHWELRKEIGGDVPYRSTSDT